MMNYPRYGGHRRRFFFVPFIIALFFVLSAAVQYLWNMVLPDVTHLAKITYWQAAALLLLSRILFGNFHFGRRGGPQQQMQMRQKWAEMSDEDRVKFKEEFRQRHRHHDH